MAGDLAPEGGVEKPTLGACLNNLALALRLRYELEGGVVADSEFELSVLANIGLPRVEYSSIQVAAF